MSMSIVVIHVDGCSAFRLTFLVTCTLKGLHIQHILDHLANSVFNDLHTKKIILCDIQHFNNGIYFYFLFFINKIFSTSLLI